MAEAINPRGAGEHARIIPFPKHRIVRYRRAPKGTPADDAFVAGLRLAVDLMATLHQKGIAR